ncbi:MAG: DUF975 family protein [Clostridia bacterium]|nr:DUF975 family protein [Clostridia bacterium]
MFAKDYRRLAWEKLSGNWGTVIVAYLLYALILGALSSTGVGGLLLGGPLTVGMAAVMLTLLRKGSTKIETLFDGLTTDFVSRMLAYILYSIYIALWSLLFFIPGIVKTYSYAMTFYIMRDNPGIGANEAITRSRQMMDGHKWQLFCLHFSFIGWILLSILTCGILVIWVAPYMEAANATFYESIKGEPQSAEFTETDNGGTQSL